MKKALSMLLAVIMVLTLMVGCGDKNNSITPPEGDERRKFLLGQAMMIAQANTPEGTDFRQIARRSNGSLRRVHSLITKGEEV